MKKSFKIFTLVFTLMFALVVKVNAAEVSTEDQLRSCVEINGNTCVLKDNIELSQVLYIDVLDNDDTNEAVVTIDLNGKKITPASNFPKSFLINITHGSTLVIEDSVGTGSISTGTTSKAVAAVFLTNKDKLNEAKTAGLVVNGGTLEGYWYGIAGNGTTSGRSNTSITINGGTIKGLKTTDSTGIFHPQYGTVIINDGTVSGTTGIEMRAGVLEVNGGTIVGDYDSFTVVSNNNGTTTIGVGIAIAQHTTTKNIDVTITGGTIKGYKALNESNPEGNADVTTSVALNIEGGNFETMNGGNVAIDSENLTEFISGGTFSSGVEKEYLVTDIKLEETEDGSFVAKNYWLIFIDEDIKNGTVTAPETAYEGDLVKLDIKPEEGYNVSSIEVLDHLDRKVEVTDNLFTMPNSPVFVKVTFAKEEVVPNTGDNVVTFIVIGLISLVAVVIAANKLRKNA